MPTKKNQIIRLIESGESLENIINRGFNKKYVGEVARNIKNTEKIEKHSENEKNILLKIKNDVNEIKTMLASPETFYSKKDKAEYGSKDKTVQLNEVLKILEFIKENDKLLKSINLNISISISEENIDKRNQKGSLNKDPKTISIKINPIDTYRSEGEETLREILNKFEVEDLREIAKQYTPDVRGYVYKWNDKGDVIDYIVDRSGSLSKKGNVFIGD